MKVRMWNMVNCSDHFVTLWVSIIIEWHSLVQCAKLFAQKSLRLCVDNLIKRTVKV